MTLLAGPLERSQYHASSPRLAVAIDGHPETRGRMEAAGVQVHPYGGGEISLKGCGGPTCLTRTLERTG